MDRLVNRRPVRWSLLLSLVGPALASAQAVGDPTLPPPSMQSPGAAAPVAVAPALPELQSILVSREAGAAWP